ncbi:LPXTG cell wall anchor domain-containing protein [Lysinibacillus mangiferihumi]|uniref:LPXTG cell wall anchor domain-containing protein n=1 Tax=Lysinibacillus mangiferihumi TaxID=1130819 RepID=A0A4U2YV39_9BACI|nr:collagen binding domain-containing protein [Lysinibacillus mangiferihumi]TKI65359.1 LPXTG cell wall anchor domain-containing protein [Lysinibacillus mangiferihumi]
MKKLNLAIITLLLVFQTVLSPISVLAEDTGSSVPPAVEANSDEPTSNSPETGNPDATVPTPSDTGNPDATVPTPGETGNPDATVPTPGETGEVDGTDANTGGTDNSTVTPPEESDKVDGAEGEDVEGKDNAVDEKTDNSTLQLLKAPITPGLPVDRDDPNFKETITLKIDSKVVSGTTAEGRVGDEVEFRVDLELAPGHKYSEGSTLTYTLPNQFKNLTGDTPLFYEGELIGNVVVSGSTATLTFTDKILDDSGAGTLVKDVFYVIKGTLQSTNNEWSEDIEVPGFKTIKLNFQPKANSGQTITKTGKADREGINSEFITWKVDVNTNLIVNTDNDNTIFTDTLSGEHSFVGSPTVTVLNISPNGEITEAGLLNLEPKPLFDGNKLTIKLPNKAHTGYRINYTTQIGDPGNVESANFGNIASYNETPTKEVNVKVGFGKPLDKESSGPSATDLATYWTIKYNFNKRSIPAANAELTDVWTDTQVLEGSVEVYKEDGSKVTSGYTVDTTSKTNGFTLKFSGAVNDAYVIKYKTRPALNIYPTSDIQVENTVIRKDMRDNPKVAYSKYSSESLILDKTATGVDYTAKTMSWEIEANQARYTLKKDTIFEDTYNGSLLSLTNDFIITVDGIPFTNYELTKDTAIVDGKNRETGFNIKLNEDVSGVIVIKYTTDYDIKDTGSNSRDFNNTVTLKDTGVFKGIATDTDKQTIKNEQKTNGKKDGYYDYATKTFHWYVELNFNYNTFTNAVFKDTLPASQKVTSIKVTKGTLDKSGKFVPGSSEDIPISEDKHEILLELGPISVPYKVEYTSVDADDVFPHGSDIKISNEAALYEGTSTTPNAKWDKVVTVENTKKILDKTGNQVGASPKINWDFKFNYAQSQLNNIEITDIVGKDSENNPEQLILKDTFKVYEVSFTGTTAEGEPKITRKEITLPAGALDVDIVAGTFKLKLPDGKKAYDVEYSTVFMGSSGSDVENYVNVAYTSLDGDKGSDVGKKLKFTYIGGGNVSKVPFIIIKTDAATGLPMKNVKFDLYGPYTGQTLLASKSTDEFGYLNYGLKLAQSTSGNKYRIVEEKQDGYKALEKEFELNPAKIETTGKYKGYQVIEIENEPESGLKCSKYELTVYDIDGNVTNGGKITLVNKATDMSVEYSLGTDGKISFTPDQVKAGQYDVKYNGVTLKTITIQYNDECGESIQPAPKCDNFTIAIEDTEGNIRTNIKELTLKSGTTEAKVSPNAAGKFVFASNKINPTDGIKPGDYMVYEGNLFLGTVNLTYAENCGHEFIVKQAPKCETFKLTVKDVDGKLVADGTSVTVKDTDDKIVATKTTTNGVLELTNLQPGIYKVEVNGKENGSFQSNIDCEATVQPAPSCPIFTLTVKDENGNVRPNVSNIMIKDKNGATIASNKTTDAVGQVTMPSQDIPSGDYSVYQGDLFIGQITVQYSVHCQAEIVAAPTCPSFTLTVQTAFGTPLANAIVTVKDVKGNTIKDANGNDKLTTSVAGTIVLPDKAIQQGTYNVYEGSRLIGSFVVKDTCSALVKPSLPGDNGGGGGGGSTPPEPGKPVDPNKPTPEPGKPVDPNKPTPEPGKPVDPNKPTPEPGKPVDPNKPTPEPGKPVDPNKPTPDPEQPVNPENPSTNTEEPSNPGNPSTDSKDPTAPGKTDTSKPTVQDVIDQGKNLPSINTSTANKDTLDAYKDFIDNYNQLSKEEQEEIAKSLDVDKIKADAKRLETQLQAQGKLPQTDGANQTALTLTGVALVLGALFFLRRRKAEMK